MKRVAAAACALGALAAAPASAVKVRRSHGDAAAPGTIQQVVSMLQGMLDKSKAEGKTDKDMYDKYNCYCDDNEKEKKQSVEDLTKQIGLLENEVAGLQADTGGLSIDAARLKADMTANEEARAEAEAMRTAEAEAYTKTKADLTAAIAQLGQAVDALGAIGADQSMAASAEHEEFMAGYKEGGDGASMLRLRTTVQQALVAAGSFVTPAQRATWEALLQTGAPIGGAYSSQAGGVVGILKGMKETFSTNLESATEEEEKAKKTHAAFIKTKKEAWDEMDASYQKKQGSLGSNDGDLATKKTSLETAKTQLDDDTSFLEKLEDMCSQKAKEYDQRVEMRANEEAAITEAIAMLDSDQASGAFDKVAATGGTAAFVQLRSVRRRVHGGAILSQRSAAQRVLREAASKARDTRVARIAGLLALGNPFTVVLAEIDKMKELLKEEAAQDLKQKTWCEDARTSSNTNIESKTKQMEALDADVTKLDDAINHPETGLLKLIADSEKSLEENSKAMADETEARREENQQYQDTVSNCMSAKSIVQKAIDVLDKYYKKMAKKQAEDEELGLLQKADPAPPATWDGKFSGQSSDGKKVIGMLEGILASTETEAGAAHAAESAAQSAYEDSMAALKESEKNTKEDLASSKEALAKKKEELEEKRIDLEKTEDEKRAIERYLKEIKPGCDWIVDNYATRETNRGTEEKALDKAVTLLKGTTAYAQAETKQKDKEMGPCKDTCNSDAAHVDCKACLAEVSVPGYCAGHPGTPGC